MKKPSKGLINFAVIFVVMMSVYFIVTRILRLPVYFTFLFYLLAALVFVMIKWNDVTAIRGNIAFAQGNEELANKFLGKAILKNTNSPVAHLNYSIIMLRKGDGSTALELLKKSEGLKPDPMTVKNIKLTRGSAYWLSGEVEKAIGTLENMRKEYDYVNENVLATLGFMYIVNSELDKAEECSRLAIKDKPDAYSAWDNLGQIAFIKKNYDEAKEHFNEAITHREHLAESLFYLGQIAEIENDTDAAIDYYERADKCKITCLNTVKREDIENRLEALKK